MVKLFAFTIAAFIIVSSPISFKMLQNEYRAYELSVSLKSIEQSTRSKVLSTDYRVFNSGNGDGCDYEAFAIVQHYGDFSSLRETYLSVLGGIRMEENQIYSKEKSVSDSDSWGAKIIGQSTELYISPASDNSVYYLIRLGKFPREVSLDFRCW